MFRAEDVRAESHWFVVPNVQGTITGGTLYNRELIAKLELAGFPVGVLDLNSACAALAEGRTGFFWLDTLYLAELAKLRSASTLGQPIGLILHYLPALVRVGSQISRADLSAEEALALDEVAAFLAPSPFMRATALRLAASPRPVLVVEPGRYATRTRKPHSPAGVQAILVANLVPGKGVLPFLLALAKQLAASDELRLTVVGSASIDPDYALACHAAVGSEPALRQRVTFEGALPPEEVVARIARSNLMISASFMEAYGMALAEARTLGIPIVARDGGNVAAHVRATAGGELVQTEQELARACIELCRNALEHHARFALALQHALEPRPWSDAARDFIALTLGLGLNSSAQPM